MKNGNNLVSFCITSFNRKRKLKSCIESFLKTNCYDLNNIELIIVDNGSTDNETVEYINSLGSPFDSFQKVLNEKNDYPCCLHKAKNQARKLAKGNYFIDCPDDHLFVLKHDWISESIDYFEKETQKVSCSCHYSYPLYRFGKPNNLMKKSQVNSNFYVSELKGYADYNFMPRKNYEDIGKFREDPGSVEKRAEADYMTRAFTLGYKRAIHKYPVSIINGHQEQDPVFDLKEPITMKEYTERFSSLERPCSNEELTEFLKDKGSLT
jgi:glycosyltransferase involved in cell wall biosynthesis